MTTTIVTTDDLLDPVGYLEETTEDTYKAGSLLFPGPLQDFTFLAGRARKIIDDVNNDDIREIIEGARVGVTDMTLGLVDTTFLKYLTELPVGTGTINKSICMAARVKVAAGTVYYEATMARPATGWIAGGQNQDTMFNMTLRHNFNMPTTLTGGTMATDPGKTSKPSWKWSDGGGTPVLWGAQDVDILGLRVDFNRHLISRPASGGSILAINRSGGRTVSFQALCGWKDQTLYDDLVGTDYNDLVWTLKTGSGTLTLSNCKITAPIGLNFRPPRQTGYEVQQAIIGSALSAAVT
jgi:hypothetical protein